MTMAGAPTASGSPLAWAGGLSITMAAALSLASLQSWGIPAIPAPSSLSQAVEAPGVALTLEDIPLLPGRSRMILVREVLPTGSAARAGIQPGDILACVQDHALVDARHAATLFEDLGPHSVLQVEVLRSGTYLVLSIPPGAHHQ